MATIEHCANPATGRGEATHAYGLDNSGCRPSQAFDRIEPVQPAGPAWGGSARQIIKEAGRWRYRNLRRPAVASRPVVRCLRAAVPAWRGLAIGEPAADGLQRCGAVRGAHPCRHRLAPRGLRGFRQPELRLPCVAVVPQLDPGQT